MKRVIAPALLISLLSLSAFGFSSGLINGDFETGDLSGWTTFTTVNGDLGASGGFPTVVLFDTDNDGISSLAATFRVGQQTRDAFSTGAGGGIFQNVNLGPGTYTLSADIASHGSSLNNSDGGFFRLLFDGVVVDAHDFGAIPAGTSEYSMLTAVTVATPGVHEIRFEMTRNYLQGGPNGTPVQYIDNVALVPEPTTITLLGFGSLVLVVVRRRG